MASRTYVEKLLGAGAGAIVFRRPDIVLTHDNTASIEKTFEKMGGKHVADPSQLLVVLDHNAPPTNAKLATQYQSIRDFAEAQGVENFYDVGNGICHQVMSYHARPGMVIVGSDSHTCTAGAFNALAAGIDRTEAAGIWKRGETWLRVPETLKINLHGKLPEGVYAKDISLWIIGMIGSAGANYMSIEYHGDGVGQLSIAQRMTLANLASEMGAKNAVFPPDNSLAEFLGETMPFGLWADPGAHYARELDVELDKLYPLVAAPHHVDNVKAVAQVAGHEVQQGLIGTCTNGRLEDFHQAAEILKGKHIKKGFQLLIAPASKTIFKEMMEDGTLMALMDAGATILSASCGPCLGTGQGIPADGATVLSTANRNFKGRMGNKNAEIFLASPACVAASALSGTITDPRAQPGNEEFPYPKKQSARVDIPASETRRQNRVWNYKDADNLNTDQMFAGNLTYNVLSSDGEAILPHLFEGFDPNFTRQVQRGDIIIAGDNFGCGSSREHPSVGLAYAGVKAVVVRSVNRIFYRSAINQGLPLIVLPEAVDAYKPGDPVDVDFEAGKVKVGEKCFPFGALPDKLMEIIEHKGLVNWIKAQ